MDDDYSNVCTHDDNDPRCCKCIHFCTPIGCLQLILSQEEIEQIEKNEE